MKEPQPQQPLQTDEERTLVVSGEEATLVSPRFDDEETLVARPVVPLDAEASEAHAATHATQAAATLSPYARRRLAPRRAWVLAAVLVSLLVGGVLGGAGLYIYQRQSQDERAVAAPQAETPAGPQPQTQPPAPEPTAEVSNVPQPEVTAAVAEPTVAPDDDSAAAAPPEREPEAAPAAVRRDDAGGSAGTRKRGKKGEHDEEVDRSGRREGRTDEGPVTRARDTGAREARRVDTISYRPRRAERRERARRDADGTDRLRRIFEGAPE